MPIVINELVIRGTVEPPTSPNGRERPAALTAAGASLNPNERDALIAACVDAVLRALERMKER